MAESIHAAGRHGARTADLLSSIAAEALRKAERKMGRRIMIAPSVAAALWAKAFRDKILPDTLDGLIAIRAVDDELRGEKP